MPARIARSIALLAAIACGACAAPPDDAADYDPADTPEALESEGLDSTHTGPVANSVRALVQPDPQTVYYAGIEASGSGCPEGSVDLHISEDGLVFTATFNAYETLVSPEQHLSVKDCRLSIQLHAPSGLSFSVQSLRYGGYAFLESGVRGRQTVSYGFDERGKSGRRRQTVLDLRGPYDDAFLESDEVSLAQASWSACGGEHVLNVDSQLRLQRHDPSASGYMNITSIDGSSELEFELRLARRSCEQPGGGGPGSGGPGNGGGQGNGGGPGKGGGGGGPLSWLLELLERLLRGRR